MMEGLKWVRVLMINSICPRESFQLLFYFNRSGCQEARTSMRSREAKEQVFNLLNVICNCECLWTQ